MDEAPASDDEIVTAVSRLIGAYVESLTFAQDDDAFVGSPRDLFLAQNHMPTKPDDNEPQTFYRERLRAFLRHADDAEFLADEQGPFALHDQPSCSARPSDKLVCASTGARRHAGGAPGPSGSRHRSRCSSPGPRDLGHSAPYFHTGKADTLEDVIRTYVDASRLARDGRLPNGAPELARLRIDEADVAPLAAFLRALNEDYE